MSISARRIALKLALALCMLGLTAGQRTSAAEYSLTPIAENLNFPWSLSFLPDGTILVTELGGTVRVIKDGKIVGDPIGTVSDIYRHSQGGLFEVLPHPDFAQNQTVYISYASGKPDANRTRVVRARFDGTAFTDTDVIFSARPDKDTPVHYGGRMTFLPDGTLLVALGDGFDYREDAQRLDSHIGTIVRINQDGSVPEDNPFVGRADAQPEIWTYGHRNVQGIVYDAPTGNVYAHEHGPRGGDELNLIEKGNNYGWPVITYGMDYSGAFVSPYKEREGMEQPMLYWVPSIAPAGLVRYRGGRFPDWEGDFLVAALAAKEVRRVDMKGETVEKEESLFKELNARIRDIRQGPDGSLYIVTDGEGGRVFRVDPAERPSG